MSTKMVSNSPTEGLDWKITRKRVDTTTGEQVREQPDNPLKQAFERTKPIGEKGKIDPGTAPEVKGDVKQPVTDRGRNESTRQGYQEVKADAGKQLGQLTQGQGTVKQTDVPYPKATGEQAQQQLGANQQMPAQKTINTANIAAVAVGIQRPPVDGTKKPIAAEPRQPAGHPAEGAKTEQAAGSRQRTAGSRDSLDGARGGQAGLRHAGAASAAQAGVVAAGQGREKTTQQTGEIADNIEEAPKSPRSHAASASRQLGGIIAGQGELGSSTTTGGEGEFEKTADGVELVGKKDLGFEIYNATEEEVRIRTAAVEYEGVEQILRPRASIDEKIKNWEPDKGLLARIITDTEKELAAAQLLIKQLRSTRGRGTAANGMMSA